MHDHTSREIAEAIPARAESAGQTVAQHLAAPVRPVAVELEHEECDNCGGEGKVLVSPSSYVYDPRAKLQTCGQCDGFGSIPERCLICGEPATTELTNGERITICDECTMAHLGPADGVDYVVAFALTVSP